ncbi:MAG: DegT/DnrJ/EryC1/StrS family aminotransferase [Clostridia bacterium]|nr:DegT/DnrJ/EryC1/StrS family aminotransferase [Clostridia bacterium]
MKTINVTRSSMPDLDEYIDEIKDLFDSHWLTNMGEKHQKLEKELESMLNVKHVTLYTNGHLALEGIWEAYNFPKGSEVITTPFTFVSTTHAISRSGLIPVFCDIDPNSYCIDPNKIEQLITPKTVAICPVHVYGYLCDVDKIALIAKKYNLKVIYDAAHAFGVKYNGKSSASFGDVSMFSFHATKVFNTIEGGALCYNDDSLVGVLNDLKNFGIHGPEDVNYIGGNAKMNEFQASMGLCNLRHLDREILKRKRVVEEYKKRLGGVKGIKLLDYSDSIQPNYAYFPVIFDGFKDRDSIFSELKKNNIIARKYFYPLTNSVKCYKKFENANPEKTPVAKYVSERVLTLPLYADLTIDEVNMICDIILK